MSTSVSAASACVPFQDWKGRMDVGSSLTPSEIHRIFARVFASGCVCAGMGAISLATMGVVTWPVGFMAIPSFLIASGLFWYGSDPQDYEHPEVIERFSKNSGRMSLQGAVHTYGWNDILRFGFFTPEHFVEKYRQELKGKKLVEVMDYYESTLRHLSACSSPKYAYRVPSPRESAGLWRQETVAMTFEQIIQTYPLDRLQKYSILESGELKCLKELKKDYEVIKARHETKVAAMEQEFQQSTDAQKRTYDQQCAYARLLYDNTAAVRELQGFELGYIRERQLAQEMMNRSKLEARQRFDAATAELTDHGRVPYNRLQESGKSLYNEHLQELQRAENLAENTARQQIEAIDAHRISRLAQLGNEERHAKQELDRTLTDAKARYDQNVATQREQKKQRLAPLEASFRSSVSDFHVRYRACVRLCGA